MGSHGNIRLLRAAESSIRFWAGLQHRDGSFDEAYPNERSLAATSFTAFYVGIALERLRNVLPRGVFDLGVRTMKNSARWLALNGEHHGILSNHLAAAAGAIQVAGDLLGTDEFRSARDRYLGIIYKEQSASEGWMREYGGADPGYQSHGMFYLAEIYKRTQDHGLLESLRAASDFLAWFTHPDGTIGGEYASRGTKFAFPAAFEMLAPHISSAAAICQHLRARIADRMAIGPEEMDAWNLYPMLNNYIFALESSAENLRADPLPWQRDGAIREFPLAGLTVARTGNLLLVTGLSMGGVVKIWETDTAKLFYEDCGYAMCSGRRWAVSQGQSGWEKLPGPEIVNFRVSSRFRRISQPRFSPVRFMLFRLFTTTIGRFPFISRWLKSLLVAVLIRKSRFHQSVLTRVIRILGDGGILIEDELTGLDAQPISIERQVPFHMGSARYFQMSDFLGAKIRASELKRASNGCASRSITLRDSGRQSCN